jgi:uncharacterized protein (TIGR02996 family)
MTPEEVFLQAIVEAPDDDTPRLVFADWLDEHGNSRGEFIRVQCRLASAGPDDPRRPGLEVLERRLLEQHQDEWLGPLRPVLSGWTFRRGFLDAIAVPAAAYLERAAIHHPPTVRRLEVDLHRFQVPASVVAFVPESTARENDCLPIGFRGTALVLATAEPIDRDMLAKFRFIFSRDFEPVAADAGQLVAALDRYWGVGPWTEEEERRAGAFFTRLIAGAVDRDAREVRIEPGPDHFRVLFVGKAGSAEGERCPRWLFGRLVTRIRIAAGIWLGDRRDEQTGTVRLTTRGKELEMDVRIRQTGGGPHVGLTLRPLDSPPVQGKP